MRKRKNNIFFDIAIVLIVAICAIYTLYIDDATNSASDANLSYQAVKVSNIFENNLANLEVHFIDVDQGDSILIKCNDEAMLIDAGENDQGNNVIEYIKKNNIKSLKYIIGTHADSDHIGGLNDVVNNINFDTIIFPKQVKTTQTYIDFVNAVKNKNKKFTLPVVGQIYKLGDASFQILSPENMEYEESNNYSIVIKLEYNNTSYLFMGDAEKEIEEALLNSNFNLQSDVIKIGHHGSSTSSTKEFIEEVDPKIAVISCGVNNKYNHPHKETIELLDKDNINVLRTDINGNIIIKSNGNKINIIKEKTNEIYNR